MQGQSQALPPLVAPDWGRGHIPHIECYALSRGEFLAEMDTGLMARDPEMTIDGKQVAWRVLVVLSLPGLGDLASRHGGCRR